MHIIETFYISKITNYSIVSIWKICSEVQDAEIVPEQIQQEFQHIDRELQKKKAVLDRRRELYGWSRRAEAVGIAQMPPKRPTKGQRLEWEMSIIRAEEEQITQ